MEFIHLLVGPDKALADSTAFPKSISHLLPHLIGHLSHKLDNASTSRIHLRSQVVHRPLGDVLGQVGAALQFRNNQEDGHQVTESDSLDWPFPNLFPDKKLNFGGQIVHDLISIHHVLT